MKFKLIYWNLLILIFLSIFLEAKTKAVEKIIPIQTDETIKIDGKLREKIWQSNWIDKQFINYSPMPGEKFPFKTLVCVAYDRKNLYVAFKCFDSEPNKIKTTVTKRDNIFSDNWVGFSLEPLGIGQNTYDFFVNPSGIQGDILTTSGGGEDVDADWVWESSGIITKKGYQVEIRLPLKSIRFKGGEISTMRLLFFRKISRLGVSGSWPELEPGVGRMNVMCKGLFKNLKNEIPKEILPSFTYSSDKERIDPQTWGKIENIPEFGLNLKVGITSSISTELTFNPDFSQVESDAFQVMVNQRYPIFFTEKRPFFMESQGIFNIAGTNGDSLMVTSLHTRNIVDPAWGSKLNGSLGKVSFGFLLAGDEWPGQSWEEDTNPNQGEKAIFAIGRGKYSLGGDQYIGTIFSRRDFAGRKNQVIGSDFNLRLGKGHTCAFSFLNSSTKNPETDSVSGNMAVFIYNYLSKSLGIIGTFEHFSKNFEMDSAFILRGALNQVTMYIGPTFTLKSKKFSWIKRINPLIYAAWLHDLDTGMNDSILILGLRFNFIKQGNIRFDYIFNNESWVNKTFNQRKFRILGGIQLKKWLNISGNLTFGNSIFYDELDPYMGNSIITSLNLILQPDSKFSQIFSLYYTDFKEPITNNKVYDVTILNSSSTYQFNKYFFIRANIRHNSLQKTLLTDLLASFTLIPGTVIHLGYGSLYQRNKWGTVHETYNPTHLIQVKQGLFFKTSYRLRF